MTCIAVRDRIMAADSQLTVDESLKYNCRKIFRVRDGVLGLYGETAGGNQIMHWLLTHGPEEPVKADDYDLKQAGAILLTKRGVYIYENSMSPDLVSGRYFAVGSGALAALAAMDRGASAREAVRHACKHDTWCRPPIRWMKL